MYYVGTIVMMFFLDFFMGAEVGAGVAFGILLIPLLTTLEFYYDDEQVNWDSFGNCLPISRKIVVTAKYLLSLGSIIASAIFSVVSGLIYLLIGGKGTVEEIFVSALTLLGAVLILVSIAHPIIQKAGVERARLYIVGLYMVVIFFGYHVVKNGFITEMQLVQLLSIGQKLLIPVGILVSIISWFISYTIYEQKEF